jgi:hypothetical protein
MMSTVLLWLRRKGRAGRVVPAVVAIAWLTMAVTVSVVVYLGQHTTHRAPRAGTEAAGATAGSGGGATDQAGAAADKGGVTSAALTRTQAARWVAQQVNPAAIVACDPEMCSVLQSSGLSGARLLALPLSATDPLGADVVVATSAVRDQFGDRLDSVYAPQVMASFGSGTDRIDVRAVAPDGAAAFEAGLPTEHATRISAGQQLLRNKNIRASAAAQGDLTAGDVDPRLMTALAALAAQYPVSIASFDDSSPGAPGAPLRGAEVGSAASGTLQPMLSFLNAQRSPYLPARAFLVPAGRGLYLLSVQYPAPSPLGFGSGA